MGQGSSDGVTCDEARDANPEELGDKGSGDAPTEALAAILSKGTYLDECSVPSDTRVHVCAAVKDGKAIGVTVATDPGAPELETCVAAKVRTLEFPAGATLRVVRTQF